MKKGRHNNGFSSIRILFRRDKKSYAIYTITSLIAVFTTIKIINRERFVISERHFMQECLAERGWVSFNELFIYSSILTAERWRGKFWQLVNSFKHQYSSLGSGLVDWQKRSFLRLCSSLPAMTVQLDF